MALSGSYQNGITGYTVKTEWTATQNVEENYSDLTIKLYLICGYRYNLSISTKTHYVYIDNTAYSLNSSLYTNGNQTLKLGEFTKRIYHNSDGTKSVNLSSIVTFNATIRGRHVGTVNGGSDTIELDKIPRMSLIKNTIDGSRYLNSLHTLHVDKFLSGNITHDIWYIIYGDDATKTSNWHYIARNSSSLDIEFAPTLEHINLQPNSDVMYIDFGIKTYKDGELFGEIAYSKGWYFKIPDSIQPSISNVEIVDANAKTKALGVYVQNHSKLNIKTTASGIAGSTIKSIKILAANQVFFGADVTTNELNAAGTVEIKIIATDSRNKTFATTRNITVEPYFLPSINNFKGQRLEKDERTITIERNFKMASIANKNPCNWKVERRQIGSSNWLTIQQGTDKVLTTNLLAYNNSTDLDYEFRLTISDFHTSATQSFFVGSSFRLYEAHSSGTGLAVGQIAKRPNMFDVNLKTAFFKGIETEKWTKMHLYNSTKPYDAKNELKYFKDPLGLVHIQGVVKDTTSEWLARITRADCRPEKDLIISVPCTGFKFAFLKIYEDGNILIDNRSEISTNWISLDCITFKAKE
jgi:hypothetical protein